ncbi:LTA synthase family protein [Oscillibacter sp.]|uniref:LTA synthase family protein n=1 Tax=Oscillibacter sp. TaxID=1945593 RepID=UPI002619FED6|nr:LTA synthase family protein [Oscillibacter sp.]MDD3347699.1 LTA synthase family protein [Oscillibacter sp.]
MKRLPTYRLSLLLTLLWAVLLAGGITLLALWCQPNALREVLSHFKAQPLLIVLNALPIGLLLLALTCLLRNVFWSAALVNFCVCALSIANRIKLEVRDEPVFPRDFGLLKEVGSAMGSYQIRFPSAVIVTVVLISATLAAAGVFIRCAPFPIARLRGWLGSVLGAVCSIGLLAGLIVTLYASNDLYNSFAVSNAYYIPSVFNELGFPYCFCHQFTTYPVDKPEGFNRAEAEAWAASPASSGEGKAVNVIMVMNEAFSDITDADVFAFSAESDPLPNLHALEKQPNALSGHVVVPGFAGGTANTEFDVLTGMQTGALSDTTTSAFRVVNRNLESLFRVFDADGYRTSFFHPGDDWFYNRENVYGWLGAETTLFADQMENLQYKGRWATDDYMAGLIEQEFEETTAAGQSLFHYTTTIQNHMSYTADKYGAGYLFPDVPLQVSVSPEVETLLKVYVEGVRDADAMLGRLTTYFGGTEEPVVLVFWGDHLPYLGDNQAGYTALGMDVKAGTQLDPFTAYETPYLIWANDAAVVSLDWGATVAKLDLPKDGRISAAFLGAAVVELTGRKAESPWFSFLCDLRREVPVVQKDTYLLSDGACLREPELRQWRSPDGALTGEQLQSLVQKWRQWSYYKLRYEEIAP